MKTHWAVISIAMSLAASAALAAGQTEPVEATANQQPVQMRPKAAATALDGAWTIVEVGKTPVNREIAVLLFNPEQKSFSAGAGCNTLFGSYHLRKRTLTMEPPATTLKDCPGKENAMALEAQISETIAKVKRYQVQGDTLLLKNRRGRTVLRARR